MTKRSVGLQTILLVGLGLLALLGLAWAVGLPGEQVAPPAAMPTGTIVANAILPTRIPIETPHAPGYP